MDHTTRTGHFRSEALAFEKAARRAIEASAETPLPPSCPGWSVSDLAGHVGGLHR